MNLQCLGAIIMYHWLASTQPPAHVWEEYGFQSHTDLGSSPTSAAFFAMRYWASDLSVNLKFSFPFCKKKSHRRTDMWFGKELLKSECRGISTVTVCIKVLGHSAATVIYIYFINNIMDDIVFFMLLESYNFYLF